MNEPNGCADCGIPYREHGWRWSESGATHLWIEPPNGQRLARMKRNRLRRRGRVG